MIQNHIHLAMTLGLTPEFAPIYQWRVTAREEVPVSFADIDRSIGGVLHVNVVHDDNGDPVKLSNFAYEVKVQADYGFTVAERSAQLKSLHHERVWLCDNFHAANGADHTPDLRPMFVSKVGTFPTDHITLLFFFVRVELEDDSL